MRMIKAASDKDLSYLDNEGVQIVVDYKWKTYTLNFYLIQFFLLLVFIACLVAEISIESQYGFE